MAYPALRPDVAAANPDEPHRFASGFILRVELAPGAGLAGGCLITVDPELGSHMVVQDRLPLACRGLIEQTPTR